MAMNLVGLGVACSYGGMNSDDRGGMRSWNGTCGDSDIDDLRSDIVYIVLLVESLVDGRCHGQNGAEGSQDDGRTHLDIPLRS